VTRCSLDPPSNFISPKIFLLAPVLTEAVITAEPGREVFVFLEECFSNMCLLDDGWGFFPFSLFLVNSELSQRHQCLNETSLQQMTENALSPQKKVLKKLKIMILLIA